MSRMTSGGNVAHERVVDFPLNAIMDDGAVGCDRLRRWLVVVDVVFRADELRLERQLAKLEIVPTLSLRRSLRLLVLQSHLL